ncbi:unnamed protein product [Arabis nemorensis]|uniref:3'-5' exonuclease domain-containing protein n=1 Tax=Arabis nemorensis TaxID=586526 RepID=A0A565BKZ8_9BRAS|nr:unnamed protein product [Arabis nemorensis]
MAPRIIRRIPNRHTHPKYNVDFFGKRLQVSVTRSASVMKINRLNRRENRCRLYVKECGDEELVCYNGEINMKRKLSKVTCVLVLINKLVSSNIGTYHSVIRRWINTVRFFNRRSLQPLVVGIGIQWTADYTSDPPPDILHLGVGNCCLIIQLNHCNRIPNVLRSFFVDRSITFVGVWNSRDKIKLERCRHKLKIWRLLDVKHYLARSIWNSSVEKIVEEYLGYEGVRVDKEISRSNWGVRNLSRGQILQATQDSYVCFKLGVMQRLWEVCT